jgi:signal transduction histidine kinase
LSYVFNETDDVISNSSASSRELLEFDLLEEDAEIRYVNSYNIPIKSTGSQTDESRVKTVAAVDSAELSCDYAFYHYETEGFIVISVVDSGIGISEEGIAKLFQPF